MRSAAHHWRVRPLAVGLLAAWQACAHGADLTGLPLEQLIDMEVYSASRFAQRSSEAPANATIITAEEIRAYGWRSLADALRSVRGLYVSDDRSYSFLGVRGFLRPGDYNSRFLLLIDGTRVNDPIFDQAQLGGEFPLDLDLVERIEFVPGPGSSVYGANAFFGVINVITKRASDLEGVRATLGAGQGALRQASASYGWRSAQRGFLLAAQRSLSDGRDLYFPEYGASAHGLDWERASRVYLRGRHGPWTLSLLGSRRDKGIATAAYGQPFDVPGSYTRDAVQMTELRYGAALAPLHGELSARLYHGLYDYDGAYINDVPARSVNRDRSRGRWWGVEASLFLQPAPAHKLVLGFDFQSDYRLAQDNFDQAPFRLYLRERHHTRRAGVYVQDEITLPHDMLLNAGLRYDRVQGLAGILSPRLALIAPLAPGTTVKAIYGRAFRPPNTYERFYAFAGDGGQRANPDLEREHIRSHELALVQQLGPAARLTLTAFSFDGSALITQVEEEGEPLPIFRNTGHTSARGVEAEYERKLGAHGRLRASISRQNVRDDAGTAVNAPRTLAKLNVAGRLAGPWHAGAEAQYVAARGLRDGGRTAGYLLANLNLYSIGLWRHVDVAITIRNLFDRRYADPASAANLQQSLEQDGRRLQVKLKVAY